MRHGVRRSIHSATSRAAFVHLFALHGECKDGTSPCPAGELRLSRRAAGTHESPGCCCDCRGRCNCDKRSGSSRRCCSNCRRASRDSCLRSKPHIIQHASPKGFRFGALYKRYKRFYMSGSIRFRGLPNFILFII